jgi:putative flavoprotein involved in K+ transport
MPRPSRLGGSPEVGGPARPYGRAMSFSERHETVIIGGGQAGLAVGYHLAQRDRPFVILDADRRTGDSWRRHWDSMRLFSPSQRDGLPGLPYPAPRWTFPTKDEFADYLEGYAEALALPIRRGVRVDALFDGGGCYVIAAGERRYEADHVVIATGASHVPKVPAFTAALDPAVLQMHSSEYRGPHQLRDGDVLVVGAGNSGADVALELARAGRRTLLSGRESGHIPFRIEGRPWRAIYPVVWQLWTHVLNVDTPVGRKVRPAVLRRSEPLIRVKPKDLTAAGVERVERTTGARGGQPLLDDGTVADVANVIWCTGYRAGLDWVDLPSFADDAVPETVRGAVVDEPGVYLVGRKFLHAFNSHQIGGVGRDAARIARDIASRAALGRFAAPDLRKAA